jgi:hypothetical protein
LLLVVQVVALMVAAAALVATVHLLLAKTLVAVEVLSHVQR